ncbi:MAG TPA: hypothetical protein VFK05_20485 [Polyangiaceae bacterium]|nr:hypothetical protein [Polyangiaceae bacterium]
MQIPFLRTGLALIAILISTLEVSCRRYWVCDEPDPAQTAELPQRLSQAGLYADIAGGMLSPGIIGYTPQFELWSDGAEKQRWIRLPEGQQIDTSNMDEWVFPEGTQLWKQFSVAGVRIETRLLEKRGPSEADWLALAYVWSSDGKDAVAAPLGASNAHHTDHDVPAAGECWACHGGRHNFVLGFSAVQLAKSAAAGEIDLHGLVEQDRLSAPPADNPVVPGNSVEVAALGYLHANCSHCHNPTRPEREGARCFDPESELDFTLAVGRLDAVSSTATYRTAVGHSVKPGNPDDSKLYDLVSSRGMFKQMPPLATEKVDASAVANIRSWIEGL